MPPTCPLYASLAHAVPHLAERGNAGLWYDKFCNRWRIKSPTEWTLTSDAAHGEQDDVNPKLEWIETLTASGRRIGDAQLIAAAVARQEGLILARTGVARHKKTLERFVTGLGREHPVENGFAWHHTLGTPYLPGSSVKGLVRTWATSWLNGNEGDIKRIFGPPPAVQDAGQGVGSVVFLEALPLDTVVLEPEVMTPHYDPYYQHGEIPGDWHSPIPIPFLAVARDQSFLFGLLPRQPGSERDRDDCARVADWLDEALGELGAGAKTAVGFGRFGSDKDAQARFEQRRATAANDQAAIKAAETGAAGLSKVALEFVLARNAAGWLTDKDAFLLPRAVDVWVERVEATRDADALGKLGEVLEHHFPGVMRDPGRLHGKKREPAYKPRPRGIAQRLLHLRQTLEG
jgi:CRISPR-associated protein Cmr6